MGISIKNKALPVPQSQPNQDEFEFFHVFEPQNIKSVVHSITNSLKKEKNLNIEYLFLPFRKEQTNENLLRFLNALFPLGNGKPITNSVKIEKIIEKTKADTLFQALKYMWCRLPGGKGIVGWKAYNLFVEKEAELGFPQRAFLEIMPKNLESPDHASLVYDFFDLIVTMASNANKNKLSARKISRMCALWGFPCETSMAAVAASSRASRASGAQDSTDVSGTYDLDFNSPENTYPNNSFDDGLKEWIPASNAMYHLTMAFIKSFVPDDGSNTENFPKTLQHVLEDNEYPPLEKSWITSSSTILQVPVISLQTTEFSRKPWDLLKRLNDLLCVSNDPHLNSELDNISKQDYMVLKNLFKVPSSSNSKTIENISKKMSKQSKKLMKEMTTKHSTFQAGWATNRKCLPFSTFNPSKDYLKINTCEIDDYFIWTWMSSISNEQTSMKRKIFGRSLILEFEFDGFKKWLILEECDSTIEVLKNKGKDNKKKKVTSKVKASAQTTNPVINNVKKLNPAQDQRHVTPVYEKFQKLNIDKNNQTVDDKNKRDFSTSTVNTSSSERKKQTWNSSKGKKSFSATTKSSAPFSAPAPVPVPVPAPVSTYGNNRENPVRISSHDVSMASQYTQGTKTANGTYQNETYKLPEVDVDESGFNIDMPDLDATHITIEDDEPESIQGSSFYGTSQNNVMAQKMTQKKMADQRVPTDDSLNNAVEDLTMELQVVEKNLHNNGKPEAVDMSASKFSLESSVKPLQILGSAPQQTNNTQAQTQAYTQNAVKSQPPSKSPARVMPGSEVSGYQQNMSQPIYQKPQQQQAVTEKQFFPQQQVFSQQQIVPQHVPRHVPQKSFSSQPAANGQVYANTGANHFPSPPKTASPPQVAQQSYPQTQNGAPMNYQNSAPKMQPVPQVHQQVAPRHSPQPPVVQKQYPVKQNHSPQLDQQPGFSKPNKGLPFGGMPRTQSMQNLGNIPSKKFHKSPSIPNVAEMNAPYGRMVKSPSTQFIGQPQGQQQNQFPPRMNTGTSGIFPAPQQRHSMVGVSTSPMMARQNGIHPQAVNPMIQPAPKPQQPQQQMYYPPQQQQALQQPQPQPQQMYYPPPQQPHQQMYSPQNSSPQQNYSPQPHQQYSAQPQQQQQQPQQMFYQAQGIPQSVPAGMHHNKLHSGNSNKTAGRKNLHAQIRNGNFGF